MVFPQLIRTGSYQGLLAFIDDEEVIPKIPG